MSKSFEVPIYFERGLPDEISAIPERDRILKYRVRQAPGGQTVTRGRLLLEPDLNLSDYRSGSLIDWIDLAFSTDEVCAAGDMGRAVKKMMKTESIPGRTWFSGFARKRDYEGNYFIVRLHNPTPRTLEFLGEVLRRDFAVTHRFDGEDFLVVGLELSVDFSPKPECFRSPEQLVLARWRMSKLIRQHIYVDPALQEEDDDRVRVVFSLSPKRKRVRKAVTFNSWRYAKIANVTDIVRRRALAPLNTKNHQALPLDGTFYAGRRGHILMLSLQDKVGDQRNSSNDTFVALGLAERRTRIEARMLCPDLTEDDFAEQRGLHFLDVTKAAPLGLRWPSDLTQVNFEGLRKMLFDFNLPTLAPDQGGEGEEPGAPELEVFQVTGGFGLDLYHRAEMEAAILQHEAMSYGEKGVKPRRLEKKGRMVAYDALNKKVKRALKKSTVEWQQLDWKRSCG